MQITVRVNSSGEFPAEARLDNFKKYRFKPVLCTQACTWVHVHVYVRGKNDDRKTATGKQRRENSDGKSSFCTPVTAMLLIVWK
ncbi:hypothetical protein POVWA2_021570 [Plasmodium ovale wallikeri]|uniref:Uncharacterized protein n=1 Tax=Plasmodium ovale wallikeri TaxID=864142 RepID=A0A1A8YRZ2_PLAOA|nr:hypothetical protein POVWA1_021590 [Plasmodium ovale wallikeri]SBT34756.1 hypothetical protein POVWA2_021570 [Plasmodium ovale wallikeri]